MLTKKEKYNIAVVGATGIVGESLLSILHSRKFPISSIIAVASDKSKGTKVKFGDKLFRQDIGIPMGSDPAPYFANLFLYHYESSWLKSTIKKNLF